MNENTTDRELLIWLKVQKQLIVQTVLINTYTVSKKSIGQWV